jgi:hypothetical protein
LGSGAFVTFLRPSAVVSGGVVVVFADGYHASQGYSGLT